MKKNFAIRALGVCAIAGALSLTSCLSDGDDTIVLEQGNPTGIPDDSKASPNPEVNDPTAVLPNIQYTTQDEDGFTVMRVDMTGVQNPETYEWIRLIGTGGNKYGRQNVWVEVDGKPKGIDVYNTIDDEGDREVLNDVVFLVDNSGSMSDEANAIARDITNWAKSLGASGLNVKFGCVGYGGNVGANNFAYLVDKYGVTGAMNLTDYAVLDEFLNGRGMSGVSRTQGFYGSDALSLETKANLNYSRAGGECGVQALQFADKNFSFRKGANRIYVNFTDDANYHGEVTSLRVEYVKDYWVTTMGTIHTVFSGDKSNAASRQHGDAPWLMSEYTGGTTLYASSDFSGVSLDNLPVTGAMQNSYIIRFTNIKEYMDGQPHEVRITVLSEDGKVSAEKIFYVVFGS